MHLKTKVKLARAVAADVLKCTSFEDVLEYLETNEMYDEALAEELQAIINETLASEIGN